METITPARRFQPRKLQVVAFAAALLLGRAGSVTGQVKQVVETSGPVVLGDQPDRVITVEAIYEEMDAQKEGWKRTLTRLRFRDKAGLPNDFPGAISKVDMLQDRLAPLSSVLPLTMPRQKWGIA